MNKKELNTSQQGLISLESEWVNNIRNGDAESFESLFNLYCQRLINFARRYVYDRQIAENIVQDVFLRIWQKRENLDSSKMIKSYLFTAVKNESFKHLRHLDVEIRVGEKIFESLENRDEPDRKFDEKEISEKIHRAINELPEKCREIFFMNRFDNLKYAEVAEILNISIKTVETQMGRALKKLRERLGTLLTVILILITSAFLLMINVL